jgi:hypothetical protein
MIMGARVSAKGVTKFGFGATDPTKQTSLNGESSQLIDVNKGTHAPPQDPIKSNGRAVGSKVKGATKTKGGAL